MIEFRKISEFPSGTLYHQLDDAYSFNDECKKVVTSARHINTKQLR